MTDILADVVIVKIGNNIEVDPQLVFFANLSS